MPESNGNDHPISDFTSGVFTVGRESGITQVRLYPVLGHSMSGSGGGGGSNIGDRLTRVEEQVRHIQDDVNSLKGDVRDIRNVDIKDLRGDVRALWGGLLAIGLGIVGLLFKAFGGG